MKDLKERIESLERELNIIKNLVASEEGSYLFDGDCEVFRSRKDPDKILIEDQNTNDFYVGSISEQTYWLDDQDEIIDVLREYLTFLAESGKI